MDVAQVLHMNGGDGDYSYVVNDRDFYIFPPSKPPYYIFPQTIKSITYFPFF
ncbi:hypothetical protein HanRHA438_Chr09g0405261 [Helianthus annuus]|nr:hypothetical protein HanRHA438_Chr09g0405261 [Helianthus annuus]